MHKLFSRVYLRIVGAELNIEYLCRWYLFDRSVKCLLQLRSGHVFCGGSIGMHSMFGWLVSRNHGKLELPKLRGGPVFAWRGVRVHELQLRNIWSDHRRVCMRGMFSGCICGVDWI